MRVTVVIPAYNRAHLIGRAIRSALDQTLPPDEVVVVDDGSVDGTAAVVEGLRRADRRVRLVVSTRNAGVSAARNLGVREASGDLVAFLDSDDAWTPNHLADCVSFLRDSPELDVVFADTRVVADDGVAARPAQLRTIKKLADWLNPVPGHPTRAIFRISEPQAFIRDYLAAVPTSVMTRALALQFPFDESIGSGEDWDFHLALARAGKRFGYIDQVHLNVYLHDGNTSSNGKSISRDCSEHAKIWVKYLNDPRTTLRERSILRRRLAQLRFDEGYENSNLGRRSAAMRSYWASMTWRVSLRTVKAMLGAMLRRPERESK